MPHDALRERFIAQLDALVPFLALAHDEVFELVSAEYESWVGPERGTTLPETSAIFRTQVCHGAFLLGYSYFEAFVADLARLLLTTRPVLLPKDKSVTYRDILTLDEGQSVVPLLVEREVRSVMYGPIEVVADYFTRPLNVAWPDFDGLPEASAVRNCILHNLAVADSRLAAVSQRFSAGDPIVLAASDVHGFGLVARGFARDITKSAGKQLDV